MPPPRPTCTYYYNSLPTQYLTLVHSSRMSEKSATALLPPSVASPNTLPMPRLASDPCRSHSFTLAQMRPGLLTFD